MGNRVGVRIQHVPVGQTFAFDSARAAWVVFASAGGARLPRSECRVPGAVPIAWHPDLMPVTCAMN